MFDIGFFELVVVGVVALVVLGPEKLPGTIRTVSLWVGRLRRSFNNIKSEIEKEVGADEIRRQLRNEEIMEKFRHTQSQVQNTIQSIKKETDEFRKNVDLEAQVAGGSDGKSAGTETADSASAPSADSTTAAPDSAAQVTQDPATGNNDEPATETPKQQP